MVEHEVTWIDPAELLNAVPDGPLAGLAVHQELVRAEVTVPVEIVVEGGELRIGGETELTVSGLGSAEDRDPDRVVGVAPSSPRRSPAWRPLLDAGARYWLRYGVTGMLGPRGGADRSVIDLEADACAEVVLADYRAHQPGENARDAISADLADPRLAVRPDDLRRLGVDDALLVTTRGQLRLGVTVRWADVLSVALPRLAEVLTSGSLLQIRCDLSSLGRARVRLTDDLAVAFARRANGKLRVQARRSQTAVRARTASIEVGLTLADGSVPDEIVAAVLDGWLGDARAVFDRLLAATTVDELDADERELLREVLVRFGLDRAVGVLDRLEALRERWRELTNQVRTVLTEVLTAAVSAGFRTEYERLERETVLLEIELDESSAVALHAPLVAGDLLAVNEAAARAPSTIDVRDAITDRLAQVTEVWGFSLGLGRWRLESEERRQQRWRRRVGSDGRQRVTFVGSRRYSSSDPLTGREVSWSVDLKADSRSAAAVPTVDGLELGLYLAYGHDERRLSRAEITAFVDEAVVWHALDDGDREATEAAVRALVGRRKVATRLELKLDHAAWLAAMETLAGDDDLLATDRLARALARALPAVRGFPLREMTTLREQLYAPVWKAWLVYEDLHGDELAAATERALRHTPVGKVVARLEGRREDLGEHRPPWTVAEVARRDADLRAQWWAFRQGVSALVAARQKAAPLDRLEGAVENLQRFWGQALHVRVLGAVLARAVDGRAPFRATWTVTVPSSGERLMVTTTP